jgi:TonB family protein
MLFYADAAAEQSEAYTPEIPVLKSGEMPVYPHLARLAGIEGTVRVKVTTDGITVIKISTSGAHKLLVDAAEQNVKTWKLYRHKPQTFTVRFVYKLEAPRVYGFANSTVLLELPNRIEVRTKRGPMAMP